MARWPGRCRAGELADAEARPPDWHARSCAHEVPRWLPRSRAASRERPGVRRHLHHRGLGRHRAVPGHRRSHRAPLQGRGVGGGRRDRGRDAVRHLGVRAWPDPHHARREPAARPDPGGEGHRDRVGHLRRRAGRGGRGLPDHSAADSSQRLDGAGLPDHLAHQRHRASGHGRNRGAIRRRRRARCRRRRRAAARRGGHRGRHRSGHPPADPGDRPAHDARAVEPGGGAGGGVRASASQSALPPGRQRLPALQRLLPAGAVDWLRCDVRMGRRRAGSRRLPAAPEGRMRRAAAAASCASLRDALAAEWTKRRTLPSTGWLLATCVVLTAGAGALTSAVVRCPASCSADTTRVSLTGVMLGQAAVAVLAVLAISGEYSTGMIRISLVAMPRRPAVLAAKAATVTGVVTGAGTVAVLGSLLAGRLFLPGNGFTTAHGFLPLSLSHEPTLRAAAGSVLYLALVALLSLGIAGAVRDSGVAITIVLGLLYVLPIVGALSLNPVWARRLERYSPMNAGLA